MPEMADRKYHPGLWLRLRTRTAAALRAVAPGRRAWRGAAFGLLVAAVAIWIVLAWDALALRDPNWTALLPLFLIAGAAAAAGGLFVALLAILSLPTRSYRWALVSTILLLTYSLYWETAKLGILVLVLVTLVAASLTGAGLLVVRRGWKTIGRTQRRVAVAGLAIGVAMVGAGLIWLLLDGFAEAPLVDAAAINSRPRPAPLDLPDPSRPGPYRVLTLTYGSGRDRHRSEYGAEVSLQARTVDGSPFIEGWSGASGWARTTYWGFDATELPLQGRVWYPDGDGPFPLVLIVHGNHIAEDFSDPGYRYLGELLASRGYVFVSVDQNFLNYSVADVVSFPDFGLKEENDARGWLLLEHLRAWREWNAAAENPLAGKVDLERIALIGHSRGGEAVAVAAAFNPLPFYPDDARVPFDYRFRLRSVVAIAPTDGQYKPAGTFTRINNVSYLVLQGSHDGDAKSFEGSRVFERVRFTDGADHFKAGVYIHRANHGQFNSSWGRGDAGGFGDALLNRRPLMPAEDQARIAKVYISAFLEATLREHAGYRPLFRDHRLAPGWLPDGIYLSQYEDSATRYVCRYDEDIDVTTTTLAGGRIQGTNLADWKEEEIQIKWGSLDTRAAILGWDEAGSSTPATYAITLPESGLQLGPKSVLTFHLADAKEKPSEPLGSMANDEKKDEDEAREPIDLTVAIESGAGHFARLPLSSFSALQPQIEAQVAKAGLLNDTPTSEVVFQIFDFPLSAFLAANPALDLTRLRTVRFVFDRTARGVVVLDDVGFRDP